MSVIDQVKPDSSNRGFLRALAAAIVFMLISGAILVTGFLAWHYPQIAAGAKTKPITLTGKDFYIAIGKGDHDGDKLTLEELDEEGSAVISSRKALFNASKYPVVEYKITDRTPGAAVVLYWRTVTHNDETLFAKLHWNGDYLSAYNMSNEEEWKGAVTELGISVSGDLRKQPITIEQVTFSPWTVKSLLLLVWTEWNAFEGWSQKSINAIRGMPKNALLSPVVAAAAWCGLAMLLYSLWLLIYRTPKVKFLLETEEVGRSVKKAHHSVARVHGWAKVEQCRGNCRGRNPHPPTNETTRYTTFSITLQLWDFKAIVIMFMVAWFALDGKWQVNLWRQLADTKYLFAGKSHHEQHLAAEDAVLYEYAQAIKKVIPENNSGRLFLLHDKWVGYARLKLMYYLLPLNVYNYGTYADARLISKNDLILLLSPLPNLDNETHLAFADKHLKLKLLYKTALGSFYIARAVDS